MSETLDTLSIKVNTNAETAAKGIDKLSDSLKKLKTDEAEKGFRNLADVMMGMSKVANLGEITSALKTLSTLTVPDNVAQSIREISSAINNISDEGLEKMKTLTEMLKNMKEAATAIGVTRKAGFNTPVNTPQSEPTAHLSFPKDKTLPAWLEKVGKKLREIAKLSNKKFNNPFENATRGAKELWERLKRIAGYRLARTVIKEITTAAKEGVTNLAAWSKAYGGALFGGRKFSNIMNSAAESVLYLKNAFGTALAPAIAALEPILYKLADAVVFVVNKFNELWAAIRGDNSYTAAIRKTTEFSKETNKAAKAVQNLLFGFDELNIIPAQGGSGGAAATDVSGMFEDRLVQLDGFAHELTTKMSDITADLKIKWKNFTTGFGFNKETVAKVIVAGLQTLLHTAIGFTLGGVPGALIGTLTGLSLGLSATDAIFNNDGELNATELWDSLGNILTNLTWAAAFTFVGGKLGVLAYAALSLGLASGLFDGTLCTIDEWGLTNTLSTIVTGLATGALAWKYLGPKAMMFGLTVGTLLSFALTNDDEVFKGKGLNWGDGLSKLEALIIAGTVGLLTWVFTKNFTVATLAFTMTLSLTELDWSKLREQFSSAIEKIGEWAKQKLEPIKNYVEGRAQSILNREPQLASRFYYNDNKTNYSDIYGGAFAYASGGTPQMGSLFIAGEAGPEFVGQIGGQTQVYNEDQLSASLANANEELINVILATANNLIGAINNKDLTVNIGDREINNASARGARLNGRAMVV